MRNRNTPSFILIIVAALALHTAQAQAEIYKWVDKDGRTHFTDKPLPNKGKEVKLDVRQPSAVPDAGEIRRLELVEYSRRQSQYSEAIAKETAQPIESTQNAESLQCTPARHRWYALSQKMPVYYAKDGTLRAHWHSDTYRGKRSYIDEEERGRLMRATRKDLDDYCTDGQVDEEDDSVYAAWLQAEHCLVAKAELRHALETNSRVGERELARLKADVERFCNPT